MINHGWSWRDFNHAVSEIKLKGDRSPTDQETENVTSKSSHDSVSRLSALPWSQILRSRATAAFPVILRAQATNH